MTQPVQYAHPLRVATLQGKVTLVQGQCCDLKIENEDGDRWWLCRMPVGGTDHRITIERRRPHLGGWYTDQVFIDQPEGGWLDALSAHA